MENTNGIKELLSGKGGLHDCIIEGVTWSVESDRLEVFIKDLNANFVGLPEYSGPQPGCLIFDNVESMQADVVVSGRKLRIYEASFSTKENLQVMEFLFSPSGRLVVHSAGINLRILNEGLRS